MQSWKIKQGGEGRSEMEYSVILEHLQHLQLYPVTNIQTLQTSL
jgi:hypothetical protein